MPCEPESASGALDSIDESAIGRAEAAFQRAYRELNLSDPAPKIQIRFRPYAKVRSKLDSAPASSIRANLSDLLRDAPPEALHSLAVSLLARLYRKPAPKGARRAFDEWASRPEVVQRRLEVQRERGRKQLLPPQGDAHDLEALFDSLNTRFFGDALRKPALGWSPHSSRHQMGHYDPAHGAIVVNRALDRHDVPQLAVEFVLYHEMLHVKHPAESCSGRYKVHTEMFRADESRFPRIEEAKRLLASI